MDKSIRIGIVTILLCIGCNSKNSDTTSTAAPSRSSSLNTHVEITSGPVVIRWPEGTQSLNQQQIKEIRTLLDVYYTGNRQRWSQSRSKLMQMGPGAKKALCLFFIKFFAAGKKSIGIEKHWKSARHELALLGEFAVPYLISTMSLPKDKLGTTGKIQCAETLAKIGRPALPALIENVGRGTLSFQRRVIETLGDIKSKKAIPTLTSLYQKLYKEAPQSQKTAIEEEADTTYGTRLYILQALAKIKDSKGSASAVELALTDPNREVRKGAIETSISIASNEYIYLLKKAKKLSRKDFPLSEYHTRIDAILYAYGG